MSPRKFRESGVLLRARRHRHRTSEQISEHHFGRPAADDATSKTLHDAGTATMTCTAELPLGVLFHRVFFALQFYRLNPSTLNVKV